MSYNRSEYYLDLAEKAQRLAQNSTNNATKYWNQAAEKEERGEDASALYKRSALYERQAEGYAKQSQKYRNLAEQAAAEAFAKSEESASTPATPSSDGSAIQEQQVTSTSGGTTVEAKSMGNGSNLVNTTQEVKSNGDMKVSSDLGTTDIKQNDSNNVNQGNSAKSTNGNDSTFTNGLNETAAGSSSRIVGNPTEVQNGITEEINREKASIVAGRSGFNDDRENKKLGLDDLIKDLVGYPKAVLEGISKTLEEVATDEDRAKETKGKDLFASMMDNIEKEAKPIIDKWKKAIAEAKKEQMAALAKNKAEKMKKQLEAIEKMPESAHKQRLIKAINEGKLEDTYGALNNERKEKKSTFDQNKYDEEVIKYIDKVLELERKRC